MHKIIIMRVTKRLVHTALLEKICASIEIIIEKGKVDALQRSSIIEQVKINDLNELKTNNLPLPIVVSYDTG